MALKIQAPEPRTESMNVRLTKADRRRGNRIAKKFKMPLTTFIYQCYKQTLDELDNNQGGAQ